MELKNVPGTTTVESLLLLLVEILEVAGPLPPPSRNEFQPALEPRNAAYTTGYAGKMLGSVFSWRKRVGKKKNKEGKKEKRGSPSFKSFIRKYEKNLGACKFLNSR